MSYIVASDLQLRFGGQVILDGASMGVQEQDRIGLVGPNGSGKSTLLKILHGQLKPDEGEITRARRLRTGYLPQDITEMPEGTLLASVLASVPGRTEVEVRLTEVEHALERAEDVDEQVALSQTLADIHEELAHFEEQFSQHEAMRILRGLGFPEAECTRPLSELSGGWKMRAALAGLLFQQPDVLLLDEPTNHLDVPSVRWLQGFLRQFRHALVLISHDRTFLNSEVNRVLSFEVEGLRSYPGNYDAYLTLRDEELRVLENQARNQDQKRKHLQRYVSRFRVSARRSGQAQSKMKQIEKMEEIKIPRRRKSLSFRFPDTVRTGEVAIKAEGICKAYGDNVLYDKLDLHVLRGDRIGIIGVNGAGKTTLLRILAGELAPDAGAVVPGYNVDMGYYAQHHTDVLTPGNTVLREVMYSRSDVTEQQARNVLGLFMFGGDEADKPISVLSGGEKARVSLARIMVQSHNVLLMDEPTNHLDLASSEGLATALTTFDGTIVFVSHNQAFVNALATKIWDIAEGTLTEYPGNLQEYFAHQERKDAAGANAVPAPAVQKAPDAGAAANGPTERQKPRKKKRAKSTGGKPAANIPEDRRTRVKRLKPLQREVAELERRVAGLEQKQVEREQSLSKSDVYENQVLFQSILKEFEADRQTLERVLARWEGKQADLDALERSLQASER